MNIHKNLQWRAIEYEFHMSYIQSIISRWTKVLSISLYKNKYWRINSINFFIIYHAPDKQLSIICEEPSLCRRTSSIQPTCDRHLIGKIFMTKISLLPRGRGIRQNGNCVIVSNIRFKPSRYVSDTKENFLNGLYVKLQFLHKRIKRIEENHSFRKGTCKISVNKANNRAKFIEIVSLRKKREIRKFLNRFEYRLQYT